MDLRDLNQPIKATGSAGVNARHHEDVFRLLVSSVQDYAIFVLDPQGRIETWNLGAERIKQYTAAEILGQHFSIFYQPEDVARGVPEEALQTAARESHWQDEGWRIRKDGSRFWASVVLTALRDDNGELVGFAKVTRDLTLQRESEMEREKLLAGERAAREEADQALNQLRLIQSLTEAALGDPELDELLKELLDRIAPMLQVDTAAIFLLERDGESSAAPTLMCRAVKGFETSAGVAVQIPWGEGFAGQIAAEGQPQVLNDVTVQTVPQPAHRQQGVRSMLGVPLSFEGRVIGVLHVGTLSGRSFTEQDTKFLQIMGDRVALAVEHARIIELARSASADARLAEIQVEAQDTFISVAAHELRTPITALRLAAQLLQRELSRGDVDPEHLQSSIRAIDRQSAHLTKLIGRLLDRVRIQHGQLELELVKTDVHAILDDVIDRTRRSTDDHTIRLVSDGAAVMAQIDSVRLEQALGNLLDNAIKFSPSGGEILVELSQLDAGLLRIAVMDRGLGVPPQHQRRLFERFYQAHGTDFRSGMGLGLYITREIVEMHGGKIWAEFPGEGGTTIVMHLPVRRDRDA